MPLSASAQNARQQLRQQLRQQRRKLTPLQQRQASQLLARTLCRHPLFQKAGHIALYWANDGEIETDDILLQAIKQKKSCYLPILAPSGRLWFKRYQQDSVLKINHFGIPEPQGTELRQSQALDLVLLPLVGFDRAGGRLGMGGGFYDRTFEWIKQHPKMRAPKLIGLAHHFQEVDQLKVESWDIPLQGVATDKGLTLFGGD